MGLNTKMVSGDGHDWEQSLLQSATLELPKLPPVRLQQQQQQLSEQLACPRCGSSNTKFCYYNNYKKSQPRHFCKACKRHWTKGGTLRNVPVGGGRKNKRLKASNTTTSTTTASRSNAQMGIQSQQQCQSLPLALGDQMNISEVLSQALSQRDSSINNTCNFNVKSFSSNGNILGSTLPLLKNQIPTFTFSGLSSSNPTSISTSFRWPDIYNFAGGLASMEDTTITISSQPLQVPTASSVMEMPYYWNWDDMDTFVPTELNIPWNDTEIKL